MKAIVIHAPRDLRIEERTVTTPGRGQVSVRIAVGGICGSDLHYYAHGGFGTVRLREPMILGHEVAGRVEAVGDGVEGIAPGQLVAVSPSRPCTTCRFCLLGQPNQCLAMRFYGSAMPFPHVQGAFREVLVADASQCVPADGLTHGEAAMAEPLAVCLHAVRQAGGLVGASVLITGCGPIGLLALHAARRAGADHIVATDLADFPLDHARGAGADVVVNTGGSPDGLDLYAREKGVFDAVFECSGAPTALAAAVACTRPGGRIIQLGLGGDMPVPMQAVTAKELSIVGSFRFHPEFAVAVSLMQKRLIDVRPLITQTFPLAAAGEAFEAAGDRTRAIKAQISFT